MGMQDEARERQYAEERAQEERRGQQSEQQLLKSEWRRQVEEAAAEYRAAADAEGLFKRSGRLTRRREPLSVHVQYAFEKGEDGGPSYQWILVYPDGSVCLARQISGLGRRFGMESPTTYRPVEDQVPFGDVTADQLEGRVRECFVENLTARLRGRDRSRGST